MKVKDIIPLINIEYSEYAIFSRKTELDVYDSRLRFQDISKPFPWVMEQKILSIWSGEESTLSILIIEIE